MQFADILVKSMVKAKDFFTALTQTIERGQRCVCNEWHDTVS
jgi:hypothetical protein